MNVSDKTLVVFQGRKIRRTWFNHEWWFAAIDIVEALTDSRDPSGYLKDMRRRDQGRVGADCHPPCSIHARRKTED